MDPPPPHFLVHWPPVTTSKIDDNSNIGRIGTGTVDAVEALEPEGKREQYLQSMEYLEIKWTNRQQQNPIFQNLFGYLTSGKFTDIQISGKNRYLRKAHRMVLCACSRVFERDLTSLPASEMSLMSYVDGFIYKLDDSIEPEDFEAILEFMYTGNAVVENSKLTRFMKAAKNLEVKGLCDSNDDEHFAQQEKEKRKPAPPRPAVYDGMKLKMSHGKEELCRISPGMNYNKELQAAEAASDKFKLTITPLPSSVVKCAQVKVGNTSGSGTTNVRKKLKPIRPKPTSTISKPTPEVIVIEDSDNSESNSANGTSAMPSSTQRYTRPLSTSSTSSGPGAQSVFSGADMPSGFNFAKPSPKEMHFPHASANKVAVLEGRVDFQKCMDQAVDAVMGKSMSGHQASRTFNVPNSGIYKRINELMKELEQSSPSTTSSPATSCTTNDQKSMPPSHSPMDGDYFDFNE